MLFGLCYKDCGLVCCVRQGGRYDSTTYMYMNILVLVEGLTVLDDFILAFYLLSLT